MMRGFGVARRAFPALGLVLAGASMAPVLADGPVDVRGAWTGVAVTDIGTFPNTLDFKDEDFTSGVVTGDANAGTYTLEATVSGYSITLVSTQIGGSYVATSKMTISADLTTMTGTFTDTNGRSGTERFTRDGPAPSAPVPTPAPTVPATPAPSSPPATTCTFGGSGGIPGAMTAPAPDPAILRVVGDAAHPVVSPVVIALDAGDPRGRVFVGSAAPSQGITVIGGRPLDASRIDVETTVAAGSLTTGLAVDPASGRVFVADMATCRILVLDGRAASPAITATIDLPGNPGAVAFEPTTGRLVVDLPADGRAMVFNRDLTAAGTLAVPAGAAHLVADAKRGFVEVGGGPSAGGGAGAIVVLDLTPTVPVERGSVTTASPAALALDPDRGVLFAIDPTIPRIVSYRIGQDGSLAEIDAEPLGLTVDVTSGPVSTAYAAAFLPGSGSVLVTAGASASGVLVTEQAGGAVTVGRRIPGLAGGVAAAVDPSTGRVFVAELGPSRVAVFDGGGAAAPSLAYELPGPLDISLAPQDVARSVGIMAFVMLLLGAPTPIFNSTLSANRALIERYVRRRRPRALRRRGGGGGAAAIGRRLVAASHTWTGLVLYLLLAGLLYALLDPRFPFEGAPRTLGTTLFAIAFGTAVSQVPGELYVRRRYGSSGTVQVALWTLGLAAGCVLITRVTGVQPGYVYGIIGGFTFRAALTKDDRGRMAWRGMTILLGAGFAAWLLRIPFQPGTGIVGGDVGSIVNQMTANVFIGAVESSAIGLIPLQFLSGSTLFGWSRPRWALLWGLGLLLFAHVILYPVSSLVPEPSATGLWTVLLSVAVYGGIAISFWAFFRGRAKRHARRARAAATSEAAGRAERSRETSGDPGDPGAAGDGGGGGTAGHAGDAGGAGGHAGHAGG